jgi:hypothetical protein
MLMGGKGIQAARDLAEQVAHEGEAMELAIAEHLRPEIQHLMTLMQHYEQMTMQFRNDLREKLRIALGVDIAQPGWVMLPDHSRLVRIAQTPQPAAEAPEVQVAGAMAEAAPAAQGTPAEQPAEHGA